MTCFFFDALIIISISFLLINFNFLFFSTRSSFVFPNLNQLN
jgi:hypothetical protein